MLTAQDKVIIRAALEDKIGHYEEILRKYPSRVTDGAFTMVRDMVKDTLARLNQDLL